MSTPPMYSQQRPVDLSSEDCRDFLRTGRCKYGASCKYNHPSNVQSGGGLKGPVDPNEPMFPVRPNEPVCQYYAKHGTCKFGQACKFNHPPQSQGQLKTTLNGSNNGTAVMLNIGGNHEVAQPIMLNQVATDSNGNLLMLQFLPQRPEEPDCIYFLKNGRCKYGGTCRYHHPIHFQQQQRRSPQDTVDVRRSRHDSSQFQAQNTQYVSQMIPSYNGSNQNLSSENQVTYLNMDSSNLPQGFKPVQIVAATERIPSSSYGVPLSEAAGSSASSLASSFETAGSTMERHLSNGDMNNASSALWSNQVRRNGSGNSLSAYSAETSSRVVKQTGPLHNVASEGNIRQRHRAGSYGSDCNGSQYDTSTMTSSTSLQSMSRNTSAGSWRNERPSDPSRRPPHPSNQYSSHVSSASDSRSPSLRGQDVPRRSSPRGRAPRAEENYEGITMMTSALLNLLDTPEEGIGGVSFDDNEDVRYPTASFQPSNSTFEEQFYRVPLHQNEHPPGMDPADHPSGSSWSSTMHGQGDVHHHRAGSHMKHRMTDHSTTDSNIGLYLP